MNRIFIFCSLNIMKTLFPTPTRYSISPGRENQKTSKTFTLPFSRISLQTLFVLWTICEVYLFWHTFIVVTLSYVTIKCFHCIYEFISSYRSLYSVWVYQCSYWNLWVGNKPISYHQKAVNHNPQHNVSNRPNNLWRGNKK